MTPPEQAPFSFTTSPSDASDFSRGYNFIGFHPAAATAAAALTELFAFSPLKAPIKEALFFHHPSIATSKGRLPDETLLTNAKQVND